MKSIFRYVLLALLCMLMGSGAACEALAEAVPGVFPSAIQTGSVREGRQDSPIVMARKRKKKKKSGSGSANTDRTEASGSGSAKTAPTEASGSGSAKTAEAQVTEDGTYTSKDEVALYIHLYNRLPDNYITKNEAQELGWNSRLGNLDEVAPGMSIGGDRFGNYEGLLPEKDGRKYKECDIDYEGGYRNAKRIIFSTDGLIFYTEDHYNTFEQLY